ncbi:MAG: hypothetical protein EOM68_03310 [Spirochaetia bacterium]|nr:hypothetical protein [Spirochaetia bacterium]
MNYTLLVFSPTGHSKACALAVAKATKQAFVELDVTHFTQRLKPLAFSDTTLIVAYPVYGGRVPVLFAEYLRGQVSCTNCKALAIATFGNRAFEDALVEMEDLLLEKGVSLIGAASIVCEHSYTDKVGAKRPDFEDFQVLDRLAVYLNGETKTVHPPGNRPYKRAMPVADPPYMPQPKDKAHPISSQCYAVCPTSCLAKGDADLCIHCCACIQVSNNTLVMENPWFGEFTKHLEATCQKRVNSELYLP